MSGCIQCISKTLTSWLLCLSQSTAIRTANPPFQNTRLLAYVVFACCEFGDRSPFSFIFRHVSIYVSIKLSYLLVVNLAIDLLFIYMQTCKRRCCYQTCVAVLLLDLYFSRWVAMSSQTYILYVTSPRTSSQFRQAHACSKQLKPVRNEPQQKPYLSYVTAPQTSTADIFCMLRLHKLQATSNPFTPFQASKSRTAVYINLICDVATNLGHTYISYVTAPRPPSHTNINFK